MRRLPLLALISVLGILLTACPAAGPGLSFTGTYTSTFGVRGFSGTFTVSLTQTGTTITGLFNEQFLRGIANVTSATISATVSQPGVASGTLTETVRGGPFPVHLFLTPTQDLVLNFPDEGNRTFLFERLEPQ